LIRCHARILSLAPEAVAVPRRRDVQIDAGAPVHRILDLAVLHRTHDLAVDLDHERLVVAHELVHLAVLEDPPSPFDLRLCADRGETRRVGPGGAAEDHAGAGEPHGTTA
jgi:hypothetical protein